MSVPSALLDSHNRVIRDLRISITDRCNFNCAYCLPETEEAANFFQPVAPGAKSSAPIPGKLPYPWKPRSQILSFEEIVRVIQVAASFGVDKIRITGGEPLAQLKPCLELMNELCDKGYSVSLETSGSIDVSNVDIRVCKVMDLKAPDSGEMSKNLYSNIEHLDKKNSFQG